MNNLATGNNRIWYTVHRYKILFKLVLGSIRVTPQPHRKAVLHVYCILQS